MRGSWEVLEHTADIGLRARGGSPEACFEAAARGLLEIIGVWDEAASGAAEEVELAASGRDAGAVLVEWLSEVLYVQDTRDALVTSLAVDTATAEVATGRLGILPRPPGWAPGTPVKAVTYHKLRIEQGPSEWTADVYFDV